LVSGADWLGPNAIAEFGTGTGLIDLGGSHIAPGIMSTNILTGNAQEVVMDPNISNGVRKGLTHLDVAFLRDLGYNAVAIPEPSSFVLFAVVGVAGMIVHRRKRSAA
jgi:hypothetical protein